MVTFEYFADKMNDLADYLNVSINGNILKEKYYPKFQRFDEIQLAQIIANVGNNYEHDRGKQFPLMPVFTRAISSLMAPSTYTPAKNKKVAYSFKWIIDGFKAMEKIEREIIGKYYDQMPQKKRMEIYIPFINEKMKNNEIYNTLAKKWGKATDNRSHSPETYFDPRDFYNEKNWV